ncbi:MAG: putative two component, sigma54 specific, transcriptional regulator [Acidobacteriales bacterium]|nr:putative two component, sigma54 specific, transcriptional regulator [Terriglobales bacterium]
MESELFGYSRGAFTGAVQTKVGPIHSADGGTLFLDEIGELPPGVQAKLLRFLQEGEVQRLGSNEIIKVDVRVIAATNVPLRTPGEKGFREDLYFRLAVFPIELPPLRNRGNDILALADQFLADLCKSERLAPKTLSTAVKKSMMLHHWSGNVRELQHAIERAFILAEDETVLTIEHLPALALEDESKSSLRS